MQIKSALRALVRRRKNNPCLTGEPGVGKTAIVEGLALILANEEECPKSLKGSRLYSLELSSLIAGTKYRGEFEERLKTIIDEVTSPNTPETILFIDEIHTIVGAGTAEGGIDAANMLKPSLARGELRVIGATTTQEYRKYIEKDAALERRFQLVNVDQPTVEETVSILEGIADYYESHHEVTFEPGSLKLAAELSDRYISDRFLPDKAIDIVDEAGALVQLDAGSEVTKESIYTIVSEMTNVPVGQLSSSASAVLLSLESSISKRLKGQDRAVSAVCRALRRSRSGLRDETKPIASFIFCGPTGTGKTELCKALSDTYFGCESNLIRIDMSEYMEKHTVSRLVGSPPGYIGHDDGGQLTNAVRTNNHCVILLDEMEKAHKDVLNILLQVLDDGRLTDGKGRLVNFKNAIIVMTSNCGSQEIRGEFDGDSESEPESESRPTGRVPQKSFTDLSPEELLARLQSSPTAMSKMMAATQDPELISALQAAMGSPAELQKASRSSEKVSGFLDDLWTTLGADPDTLNPDSPPKPWAPSVQDDFGFDAVRKFFDSSLAKGSADEVPPPPQYSEDDAKYRKVSQIVTESLENEFKPEFLNRLDGIIVFKPLQAAELTAITSNALETVVAQAKREKNIDLSFSSQLTSAIVEQGMDSARNYGARPLKRCITRYVEDGVSDAIISGFLRADDVASLEVKELDWGRASLQIKRERDGEVYEHIIDKDDGVVLGKGKAAVDEATPVPAALA